MTNRDRGASFLKMLYSDFLVANYPKLRDIVRYFRIFLRYNIPTEKKI